MEEGPVDEVSLLDIQDDTLPTEGIMDQPSALFHIQPLKDDNSYKYSSCDNA